MLEKLRYLERDDIENTLNIIIFLKISCNKRIFTFSPSIPCFPVNPELPLSPYNVKIP